jgi:hypothetical protein
MRWSNFYFKVFLKLRDRNKERYGHLFGVKEEMFGKVQKSDNPVNNLRNCIRCGQKYEPSADVGSLRCRFHPLRVNVFGDGMVYRRLHYECCGAATDPKDHIHYELSEPKGCIPIDHVNSLDEKELLERVPYAIVNAAALDPDSPLSTRQVNRSDRRLWKIESSLELEATKTIRFDTFEGRTLELDLKDIYDRMPKLMAAVKRFQGRGSASYYSTDPKAIGALVDVTFEPFYVIRRVGEGRDETKMKEINHGRGECTA